jgi:hypothetical protein
MKTLLFKLSLIVLAALAAVFSLNAQPSGRDIMTLVDDRPDGDSRKSLMKMELVNKRGSKRVRTMQSYSIDVGKDRKTIMFFQEPADVKGTGFLTWDYNEEDRDDDRWLYLPAMKKTRRISGSSAKKEYFMGSDFTYDDMGNRSVDADDHKLIREQVLEGVPCYVIESTPKSDDGLYSKQIGWIRKDNYIALRVEFYDKMGGLMKELEVNELKEIDGIWTATRMTMHNHQRNHKTIIALEQMQYNIPVENSLFTVNSLEKGYIH